MNTISVWLGVALVVLLAPRARAQDGQAYASKDKTWRYVKPGDWNPILDDIIRQREQSVRAEFPDKNFVYVAGYTKGGMNTFSYPYILISDAQVDLSGLSLDDIDDGLAIAKPKSARDKTLYSAVRQVAVGDTTLDRDQLRMVSTWSSTGKNNAPTTVTMYSYLGNGRAVQFECVDLASHGNKYASACEQFVGTFRFSDGAAFEPAVGGLRERGGNADAAKHNARVLIMVLGGVGGLVILVVVLRVTLGSRG